jgi:hypothetical protein
MPTPRPEMFETTLRGREARREDQQVDLFLGQLRIGRDEALFDGLGQHALAVDAAPVVGDADQDAARTVFGRKREGAFRVLAAGEALLGRLDAVVDGVADEVGERLAQALDHGLVEFGAFARDFEADMLARAGRKFAQDARHAAEHRADRLGANGHRAFLDVAGEAVEHRDFLAGGKAFGRQALGHHRLGDDQLAHGVDQLVELGQFDADRLAGRGRGGRRGGIGVLGGGRRVRALRAQPGRWRFRLCRRGSRGRRAGARVWPGRWRGRRSGCRRRPWRGRRTGGIVASARSRSRNRRRRNRRCREPMLRRPWRACGTSSPDSRCRIEHVEMRDIALTSLHAGAAQFQHFAQHQHRLAAVAHGAGVRADPDDPACRFLRLVAGMPSTRRCCRASDRNRGPCRRHRCCSPPGRAGAGAGSGPSGRHAPPPPALAAIAAVSSAWSATSSASRPGRARRRHGRSAYRARAAAGRSAVR